MAPLKMEHNSDWESLQRSPCKQGSFTFDSLSVQSSNKIKSISMILNVLFYNNDVISSKSCSFRTLYIVKFIFMSYKFNDAEFSIPC